MSELVGVAPYVVAGWLFLIGCYAIATSHNYIHVIVSLSVVQSSTYLLLLAIGWSRTGTAPVFSDTPKNTKVVDPVVQAMTLTDIVVGAAVTALLLALAVQQVKQHGTLDPAEVRSLEEDEQARQVGDKR